MSGEGLCYAALDFPKLRTPFSPAAGHCVYTYPEVSLNLSDLVRGTNALQFGCDRGESFWGHYIIDNAAVRCFLKAEHPDLKALNLTSFAPRVQLEQREGKLELSLNLPDTLPDIRRIDYFGHYYGFDDRGEGELSWHGFSQQKEPRNHLGTTSAAPYSLSWDISELDSRNKTVGVCAVIRLADGLNYLTDMSEATLTPPAERRVELVCCANSPIPFWSRTDQKKVATFQLGEVSKLEKATLWVKIWDGGEGAVKEPFTLNGHAYDITSGEAVHDVVFSRLEVDPAHLKKGENEFVLISDTEHHGIEVLRPGPCLTLTSK